MSLQWWQEKNEGVWKSLQYSMVLSCSYSKEVIKENRHKRMSVNILLGIRRRSYSW